MHRRILALALAGLIAPLAAFAQTPAATPAAAPPATAAAPDKAKDAPKSDTPKVYIPGLEQFMNVILIEHNKLWFAGTARNWKLAEYELGEIKEIMSDVQDIVPVFKNLPLAQMLDTVITTEVVALEKAIEAKDFRKFSVGYDKLTAACNACHQGTENGFIVIKRPTTPAFTNQDYRPHK